MQIKWVLNSLKGPGAVRSLSFLNAAEIEQARRFHATLPAYQETPLQSLGGLAAHLRLAGIYVKDESCRFGLNAFKALGGSYAIARYLAAKLKQPITEISFEQLTLPQIREQLGQITFATATDGNHGRGVAWTARMLGQKAVVYLPRGASQERVRAICAEGAEVSVISGNYDDAVRKLALEAKKNGWVIIQDTAWDGYEDVPAWIMQGYGTLAAETISQLHSAGIGQPTHVFVQAGVGSFAAAVVGCLLSSYRQDPKPKLIVVEPDQADCFYRSALAGDGLPHAVSGGLDTIMAGLACGEPNPLGWELLRDTADVFISCPDWITAQGMRILGNPMEEDPRIISGESGAVTTGLLRVLMNDDSLQPLRDQLGLNQESRILLFNTEGDTDSGNYRRIVWDGDYSGSV